MSLIQLFFGNFLNNCLFPFTVIYICTILLGKQKTRPQILIAVFIYALGSSLILSLLTYADIVRYHHIRSWTYPIVNFLDSLMLFLLISFLFHNLKKTSVLFLLTFQVTLYQFISWLLFIPVGYFEQSLSKSITIFFLYNCIIPLITIIIQLTSLYFLKNKTIVKQLYSLANYSIFSFIFFLMYQFSHSLAYIIYRTNNTSSIIINAGLLFLVTILILALKEIQSKQQIEHVQAQISEQNTYTHYLETIQKDLRKIQHDYKNMIAAVYAYAEVDEPEAASRYIETHLLSIQENTEAHLQQLQMLRKITNLELRKVILDFIAIFDDSLSLVIEHEINVLVENPSVIRDYLHHVAQNLNSDTAKLQIQTKKQTLCFCYSGINIDQKTPHVASFTSDDPKITYSQKINNQEIYHQLEIAR
ncbi:hypothetical protein ACYSNW_11355 [Enterococcus sp. LJL99]